MKGIGGKLKKYKSFWLSLIIANMHIAILIRDHRYAAFYGAWQFGFAIHSPYMCNDALYKQLSC